MKRLLFVFLFPLYFLGLSAQYKEIRFKILETSDIHGNYFPYDFIEEHPSQGSLSRIASYLKKEREVYQDRLILLDNGDILQGQPSAYYYNFVDTISIHIVARMLDFMKYNAGSMGNHDIEAGSLVYNRLMRQSGFPWMAANVIYDDEKNGRNYFTPYYIHEIEGIRIAVLGMITPAIPTWLPKQLWPEMHFEDVKTCIEQWIPVLKNREKADAVIGLFHLGMNGSIVANGLNEGDGNNLAREIPGLDIVLLGHDHRPVNCKIANVAGDSVLIINPGANGNLVSDVELVITVDNGIVTGKEVVGKLVDMTDYDPDPDFMEKFKSDFEAIKAFVSEKIGTVTLPLLSRDAYFGPSAFVDLIHRIQLELTQADVSFAAPLSYDTNIAQGDILVSDMFKLYKYENFLYSMTLSGQEIKDFLESSYGIWMNQMRGPEDHLLLLRKDEGSGVFRFASASYNFDSAAGISYTVDVTKPVGQRITIDKKMKNGKTFGVNQQYKVAVNSYRGNGGGGHLTKGAGIPYKELSSRIISSTPVDLRYYMMEWIKKEKTIRPIIFSDWKLLPEEWTKLAGKRDYQLLFDE